MKYTAGSGDGASDGLESMQCASTRRKQDKHGNETWAQKCVKLQTKEIKVSAINSPGRTDKKVCYQCKTE